MCNPRIEGVHATKALVWISLLRIHWNLACQFFSCKQMSLFFSSCREKSLHKRMWKPNSPSPSLSPNYVGFGSIKKKHSVLNGKVQHRVRVCCFQHLGWGDTFMRVCQDILPATLGASEIFLARRILIHTVLPVVWMSARILWSLIANKKRWSWACSPVKRREGTVAVSARSNCEECICSLLKKILNSRLFVGRSRLSDSWMHENAMAPFERRRSSTSRKRSSEPMTAWFWEGCICQAQSSLWRDQVSAKLPWQEQVASTTGLVLNCRALQSMEWWCWKCRPWRIGIRIIFKFFQGRPFHSLHRELQQRIREFSFICESVEEGGSRNLFIFNLCLYSWMTCLLYEPVSLKPQLMYMKSCVIKSVIHGQQNKFSVIGQNHAVVHANGFLISQ